MKNSLTCPDCGNPVELGAKFCPKCYARIESPGWLGRLAALFTNSSKPGTITLKSWKSEKFTTVDREGHRTEYRSLDEVPVGERLQMEKMQSEAMKELDPLSTGMPAKVESQPGLISQRSVSIYKIKDALGNERIYHSFDELPPETQAALKRAGMVPRTVSMQGKMVLRIRLLMVILALLIFALVILLRIR